jgi:hypothetical protein
MVTSNFPSGARVTESSPTDILIGAANEADKRRGTRLMIEIPITVMGMNVLGEPFKESTITTSISCFGCKYRARQYADKNSIVTIEIRRPEMPKASRIAHARVVWVQRPRHHRETFQIGLELELPGNVGGIDSPPADWFPCPGDNPALPAEPSAAPVLPNEIGATIAAATETGPSEPWETLTLPEPERIPVPLRGMRGDEAIAESTRELVSRSVKMTTEAMIAEEIALVRQHFTGRLEAVLLGALKVFSELTAEIVNETREACRVSVKEMEAEVRRVAQEAAPNREASPHNESSARPRKRTRKAKPQS